MRILTIFCLMILLTSCGLERGESAITYQPELVTQNGTGLIGVWEDERIPVFISENFSRDREQINGNEIPSEYELISDMAQNWNLATEGKRQFIDIQDRQVDNRDDFTKDDFKLDSEFGIYKRKQWFGSDDDNKSQIAVTQYVVEQKGPGYPTLIHADIILNYQHYRFAILDQQGQMIGQGSSSDEEVNDSEKRGPFDLPSVILHEMGHFIGLDHISGSRQSVMFAGLGPSTYRRDFVAADKSALFDLYDLGEPSNLSQLVFYSRTGKSARAHNEKVQNHDAPAMQSQLPIGTRIEGQIELRYDGECRHYINGQLTHSHKVSL